MKSVLEALVAVELQSAGDLSLFNASRTVSATSSYVVLRTSALPNNEAVVNILDCKQVSEDLLSVDAKPVLGLELAGDLLVSSASLGGTVDVKN